MVANFTNEVLNYISILLLAAIPLVIVQYNKMMDRRRAVKELKIAEALKADTDKKALELKITNAEIAAEIKQRLETSQTQISTKLERSNSEIMKKVEAVATQLNIRIDAITVKQVETHKDQLSLIADLQERADLTNGNVENIRNDLMDIEDMVEDIHERLPENESSTIPSNMVKRRRRNDKRRQIKTDSGYQHVRKRDTGNDIEERIHLNMRRRL